MLSTVLCLGSSLKLGPGNKGHLYEESLSLYWNFAKGTTANAQGTIANAQGTTVIAVGTVGYFKA